MANRLKTTIADVRGGRIDFARYNQHFNLIFPILILGVVALMLVPLPHFVLDMVLVMVIAWSVLILMVAVYTSEASHFTVFPMLLLVTTATRLGLNVSVARLVLSKGDAGQVVAAFGNFVAAGNLAVGAVVFLIITIIQFIVITKGAERVAEVAARFTLDAMPGKQMSIDADLRAGLIDQDEARKKREELGRENQFHGAMDGAMKFVKGDAIAGLIIIVINIIGGLAIGVLSKGLSLQAAAKKYTILTIGDGLVSQLPALLISLAAGILVTRIPSGDASAGPGEEVIGKLSKPKAIAIVAGFLIVLGLIPGIPHTPFLLFGAFTGIVAYALIMAERRNRASLAADAAESDLDVDENLFAVPLLLQVGPGLAMYIDKATEEGQAIEPLFNDLRAQIFHEMGVVIPKARFRVEPRLPGRAFVIMYRETPIIQEELPAGRLLVNASPQDLQILRVDPKGIMNPATNMPASWIPADSEPVVRQTYQIYQNGQVLMLYLAGAVRRYLHEFVGVQETSILIEQLRRVAQALVDDVIPNVVPPNRVADVLQRLVREGVSIKDLKAIVEALGTWGRLQLDSIELTEMVRSSLARQICFRRARPDGQLIVYQVDEMIQETIKESVKKGRTGSFIALSPELQQEILEAIREELRNRPPTAQLPVLLAEPDVRPYLRRLVELEFPECAVLSMKEIAPELTILPIGMINLRRRARAAGL